MAFYGIFDIARPELAILACILSVFYLLTTRSTKANGRLHKDLPPGPQGLPVLGYLLSLSKNPHLKLQQLARKYGPIIRVKIGSRNVIVMNSGKAMRELFHRPEFADKRSEDIFNLLHLLSPYFSNGKVWEEHRKFTLRAFRTLGLGKTRVQQLLQEEIERFLNDLSPKNGEPVDPKRLLALSVTNCISLLLYGRTHSSEEDPELVMLHKVSEEILRQKFELAALVFPWLKKIPLLSRIMASDRLRVQVEALRAMTRQKVQEHKDSSEEKWSGNGDFVDTYCCEMNKKLKEKHGTTLSESHLPDSILLLYAAGSETILTTTQWIFYTVAAYPEVQAKIHKEIDAVIGTDRTPCYSDKQNMPFTQSVLMEVQRWRTVVPLTFPRVPPSDVTYGGYVIPAGADVIANLWTAHHDPECWEKPDEFLPERFLSPDGQSVVNSESYVPFGYGKRSCLGEAYAVIVLFLYFVSVLQKFHVKPPDDTTLDMDGVAGITFYPKPQKLCFVPRQ